MSNVLCLNNGYYQTKACTDTKEFIFESKIRKAIDDFENNTVILNGVTYVVGEGANDLELDKTNSLVQKACISLAIKKSGFKQCKIISCLPVSTYCNKVARKDYENMLLEFPEVIDAKVYLEGMSAVLSDLNYYSNKLVALLDIGGNTINCMLINDKKLVPDSQFSINLGTIIITNKIRKALEQSTLQIVPECQVPYKKDTPQYQSVVREFTNEIKQELRKKQYPSDIDIRFTGGGALLFKDYLKKAFHNCYISNDAIWENCHGLKLFSEVIFNES